MGKKKLCILQNGLAYGGTDTFVINLCRQINKDLYDVTVINPSNKSGSLAREIEVLETNSKIIHTYPLNGLIGAIRHLIKLYKILNNERFDIFHTNIDLFNGPNLFVAWLARVPMRICHSHNSNQNRAITKKFNIKDMFYQSLMRWMCWHFSNRRCGCSDLANDFLYKNHDWKSLSYPTIIYNPVDLNKFKKSVNRIEKLQKLGLENKKYILTVGRFIAQKDPLFIVKILNDLFKYRKDTDMIWVGDGGDLEFKTKELIRKLDIDHRIHFMGARTDVNEIMHCSDVFLLPSNFEGLGIVLIEAQAAGLPCVVSSTIPKLSNCQGIEFLDKNSGIKTWSTLISKILDGQLTYNIRQDELDKFSSENSAKQMIKIFES